MKPRKQFTFYRNYLEAAKRMKDPERQAAFLIAICEYALDGTDPHGLPEEVETNFLLIRPVLESGRRKAAGGQTGVRGPAGANSGDELAF